MSKKKTTPRIQTGLDLTLRKLESQYGTGTIMRLGQNSTANIETISTGSVHLDLATGCGGYPKGRVLEIFGPESSGKTTLALHAIASCQANGGTAAFIDAEHALDPVYARSIGIDLDQLLVSQPDFGEQALDIVNQLIGSNEVGLVVVDSVAALVPRAELTGEMGDLPVGLQARLMSQALRKITGLAHKQKSSIIFINQLRQKIGVTFGSNEVTPGGNALKFYSSMRLDVRRIGTLRDGQNPIGSRTRVRIVKNKVAPPFKQVEFDLLYGKGISTAGELLDLAEAQGILARSGSWFTLGETRLGQGRERARSTIEENPELARSLREQVLNQAAA